MYALLLLDWSVINMGIIYRDTHLEFQNKNGKDMLIDFLFEKFCEPIEDAENGEVLEGNASKVNEEVPEEMNMDGSTFLTCGLMFYKTRACCIDVQNCYKVCISQYTRRKESSAHSSRPIKKFAILMRVSCAAGNCHVS